MNSNKGSDPGILDPFAIQADWFVIRFDTFRIEAATGLRQQLEQAIVHTINVLKLNHDAYIDNRYAVLKEYSNGDCSIGFLRRRYPFIARELERQGLTVSILGTIR
jgi:hypothetical protein